jgi:ATP-binding cassette subfamily F protein uup
MGVTLDTGSILRRIAHMPLVNMQKVSLSYGGNVLLDGVDLHIEPGDRACLIGRNGAGKSSLLKLLRGDMSPNSGDILSSPDTRIAYLPQDVPPGMSGTVHDIVESGLTGHIGDEGSETELHAHQVVGRVLSHLALDPEADCATLSGGMKRRVLLAKALACEPDLLLLDEPTNHLDIDSICWMENYLLRNCKTFLFVSHDRAFLRRIANRIIDLDRGKLAHWSCDYDTFLKRKDALLNDEQVNRAAFDKELAKE